jgi:hypothetical protein
VSARVSSGPASRQDYRTDAEFIRAVEARFRKIEVDLAAHAANAQCPIWYGPGGVWEDALRVDLDWPTDRMLWLNPPFVDIAPWAAKCAQTNYRLTGRGAIAFLVPASVGSNWFARFVHGKALVLALNGPRLKFGGKDPFPKDLMLAVYGEPPGFDVWRWR